MCACHEQVLDGKRGRCIFLYVDAVLVCVPIKHIGHVPRRIARLQADCRGMYARLNHIRVDHRHHLLTYLVSRHINLTHRVPAQYACHKLAVEQTALTPTTCVLVLRLLLRSKKRLLTAQKKAVGVALARHQTCLRRIRVRRICHLQVGIDHANDAETAPFCQLLDTCLIVPWHT